MIPPSDGRRHAGRPFTGGARSQTRRQRPEAQPPGKERRRAAEPQRHAAAPAFGGERSEAEGQGQRKQPGAALPGGPVVAEALEALRACLRGSEPLVVEHLWGNYLAYGAPQIFAWLWPQGGSITVGLLQGARLRPPSRRLLGHGPGLRTAVVRTAAEVDAELSGLLARAAAMAVRDGLRTP